MSNESIENLIVNFIEKKLNKDRYCDVRDFFLNTEEFSGIELLWESCDGTNISHYSNSCIAVIRRVYKFQEKYIYFHFNNEGNDLEVWYIDNDTIKGVKDFVNNNFTILDSIPSPDILTDWDDYVEINVYNINDIATFFNTFYTEEAYIKYCLGIFRNSSNLNK